METKLLRLLTWKSKLMFGKYPELTISQLYIGHHTRYLRWVYYNLSGISFTDDILYKIGVVTDNRDSRIEKPGMNKDLCETVNGFYRKAMVKQGFDKEMDNNFRDKSKQKLKVIEKEEKIKYSKKNLQWRNQGHRFRKVF
jgi:hypothetical protein